MVGQRTGLSCPPSSNNVACPSWQKLELTGWRGAGTPGKSFGIIGLPRQVKYAQRGPVANNGKFMGIFAD
jgi:hypothetical protein